MKPLDPVRVPASPETGAYVGSFPRHVHFTLYGPGYQASVTWPIPAVYALKAALDEAILAADVDKAEAARVFQDAYWATRNSLPPGSYVGD